MPAGLGAIVPGFGSPANNGFVWHGAAAADFNSDGWIDLFVTASDRNYLYLNNKNGTFRDASDESGVRKLATGVSPLVVDYDNDGHRDLLRSPADVIGSTANYIASGLKWRRGEPWLQEVRVPADSSFPWDKADLTVQLPRSKWSQLGVSYADGRALPSDNMPASLLLPMGRMGPAFLAYANFGVYTEWNNSLIYSITAGYLATRIAGAPPMQRPLSRVAQLPFHELRELQQLLVRAGFDVGKIDGVMGQQSRSAVKAMQIKYGLPADSWPTTELLARLRGSRAQPLPHAATAQ